MSHQIARPATAFQGGPSRLRQPRVEKPAYLVWIRTLPSLISLTRPVEAAHVRYGDLSVCKRETGRGEKPSDMWALPLSPELHREQHAMSERAFWQRYRIDPIKVCLALRAAYQDGDEDRALAVVAATVRVGGGE